MTNKLQDLIRKQTTQDFATATGRKFHTMLQNTFYDNGAWCVDTDMVARLDTIPELRELMGPLSRTEVPLAGYVNGKFISRRIDRLYVNHDTKQVVVLDYKTDSNKQLFYKKYIEQLNEYCALLKQIYNDYDIKCKILWLSDFTLENII